MHPNPVFRGTPAETSLAFARERGFGTLCVNAEDGPLAAHVPFLIAPGDGSVELHLVRSNPILRRLERPQPAVIVVSGPDGYVSPDWYGLEDQVPTWNYVAVHLRGLLESAGADELPAMLDRLSNSFEARLAPKRPWTSAKMTPGLMERMMRTIAPCRLRLSDVQGTWKLNQNKPDEARLRAAENAEASGLGQDPARLGALMRSAGPK